MAQAAEFTIDFAVRPDFTFHFQPRELKPVTGPLVIQTVVGPRDRHRSEIVAPPEHVRLFDGQMLFCSRCGSSVHRSERPSFKGHIRDVRAIKVFIASHGDCAKRP